MSEAKHTDAPWEIEYDDHGDWIVGSDGEGIAQIGVDIMDEGTNKANAYLIAAAPDLLAACQSAASLLRKLGGTNHDPEYSELLAAIAKATGER